MQYYKLLAENNPSVTSKRHTYQITDFYNNIDDIGTKLGKEKKYLIEDDKEIMHRTQRFYVDYRLYLSLFLLTLLSAIACIGVEKLSSLLARFRKAVTYSNPEDHVLFVFAKFLLISLAYTLFSSYLCEKFGTDAEGPGIPQIKTLLSGVNMQRYLALKLLIPKCIGLAFALASGFSIGKEGPYIHIAAIVAHNITKLGFFKEIKGSPLLRKQLLQSAVAVGESLTYGAVYGGIILSIELTASIYNVNNIWKSFVCCLTCMVAIKYLNQKGAIDAFSATDLPKINFFQEFWHIVGIGIISGIAGALFVQCFFKFNYFRRTGPYQFLRRRYIYVTMVTVIVCLITFQKPYLQYSDKKIVDDFFSKENLDEDPVWGPNGFLSVGINFALKFFLEFICITTPLPAGIFAVGLGSMLGRFVGEVYRKFNFVSSVRGYSLVGAAAMASNMTRTTSVCIIIFELSGQLEYMFPIFLASMIAYALGNVLTLSLFDAPLAMNRLPHLPLFLHQNLYNKTAADVCERPTTYLTLATTIREAIEMFNKSQSVNKASYIAVVNTTESFQLRGAIKVQNLINYLERMVEYEMDLQHKREVFEILEIFENFDSIYEKEVGVEGDSQVVDIKKKFTLSGIRPSQKPPAGGSPKVELTSNIEMQSMAQKKSATLERSSSARSISKPATRKLTLRSGDREYMLQILERQIDLNSSLLNYNRSPMIITRETPLLKVQFLFVMLGCSTLFVVDDGILKGVITKEKFLKLNTV
eukprot:TRINITY_DN6198_c0_g1_i3.p1 TRINITY_DN6198_c0_g1~~TRINITY_DN6198_c0_g1_i3.p1  ORF type:complete len:754 (+),score=127.83 TRINITY_DN6198_c0_g1_i3:57-2318(+)